MAAIVARAMRSTRAPCCPCQPLDGVAPRRLDWARRPVREVCDGSWLGKCVAVLGAAFKPDGDDIRDSPSLNVAA